jgi:tRNA A37 threonylcarbamoyladenosine dehydratase
LEPLESPFGQRVMGRELKKRRVKKLKVVYSEEMPIKPKDDMANSCSKKCLHPL